MKSRELFSSKLGLILAASGSAVGIGNLVGFPVNAAKNGGAAFLFIYALFVVFVCLPIMIAEMSAGRHSKLNPLGTFKFFGQGNKLWLLAGALGVITPFMIAVFYQVITVWILGYLVTTLSGNLSALATNNYFAMFINSNLIMLYMLIVFSIIGAVLNKGIQQGIEKLAKILMPLLFVLLIILILFILFLENAFQGIEFYLIPDFSKITPSTVNNALSQAFFSLSLGMGILITYGSYINQKDDIVHSAKMVAITDTSVAFFSGLLILPAIFVFNPGITSSELSDSSVSLIFNFFPKILMSLSQYMGYIGASIFATVFFLSLFFAALTSQISIIQVPLATLEDQLSWSKKKSLIVLSLFGFVLILACTLSFGRVDALTNFVSYAGVNKSVFDVIIDIFYDTVLPLNGFLICLLISLRWGMDNFNKELQMPNSLYWKYLNFSLQGLIPLILITVFINTVLIKYFNYSIF